MKKTLLSFFMLAAAFANAQSWVTQNTGFTTPSRGIIDIEIVDANTVWALAYDGANTTNNIQEFTRTTDGGNTWMPGIINVGDAAKRISNISAVSATTAFAGAFDTTTGLGGIWKTTNGGATWTNATPPGAYQANGTSWFNLVHFFDANHGLTMGDPSPSTRFEIRYTSDGGATWSTPNALNGSLPATSPAGGEYGYTNLFSAAGGSLWLGTSSGRIFKTTNMGVSWTVTNGPAGITDFAGYEIIFSDAMNGIITDGDTVYRSTDGGATWSAGVPNTGFPNFAYIPGTLTIVSTGAGALSGSAYSYDNGLTWNLIDDGIQHTAVSFLNPSTGWTGGFSGAGGVGGIFKFSGNLHTADFNAATVSVSPNPTNGMVTITGASINAVSVYDLTGKRVYQNSFDALDGANVDLSGLQTGAYLLQATADNGAVKTIKVMKN